MKKHLHCFILIFFILFIATSCKKDDTARKIQEDSKLIQSAIAGVNGPTTGTINQELTFNIVWQNADSSARFNHLLDSTVYNTRHIKLYALTNAADTVVSKGLDTISYKFKAKAPGIYYLKFYKAGNSETTAIVDTIAIK